MVLLQKFWFKCFLKEFWVRKHYKVFGLIVMWCDIKNNKRFLSLYFSSSNDENRNDTNTDLLQFELIIS